MKKKRIKINLFGAITIIVVDGKEVVISGLGKKLIAMFELLALNVPKNVSIETISETLWPESADAREVIKYSVFRLRKALDEYKELKGLDLIKTTEDGYMFSDEYSYEVDCLKMEEFHNEFAHKEITTESEYKKGQKIVDSYKGRFFLSNNPPLYLSLTAERFSSYFSSIVVMMSKYLIKNKKWNKMMELNYNAIMIEPFYEGLHYYYIKGLIELKDYHAALKHYDEIYEKFFSELGMGLSPQFLKLYDAIKDDKKEDEDERKEVNAVEAELAKNFKKEGAFYCNYEIFKHLYEIIIKNAKRDGKKCFLVLFSIDKSIPIDERVKVSNKLKKFIEESIRLSDVFTKVNKNQFAILFPCKSEDNAFMVISRITNKFYKKYDSDKYRLNYSIKDVTDDVD